MAEQATLFGAGAGAPGWLQADPALLQRKEALAAGGPPGWRPSRLILMNYWYFTYEEFHFVQGRLVLRGANASGKSTALAAAITLALDGEKRRERMDTFGGQGRSVAYYLVGDPRAAPGSDFYHHERTGYVALEFEHAAQGRHLTVGAGLYTSRGRPNLEVDFWGFALTDGRRPGRDFALFDLTADGRIPLTERQLRERIGAGGTVVSRQGDYQALVNRWLFGMPEEEYDDLLKVLVSLRSPKLNKDIKPSDVCEILARSLPGLEEDLLGRVTRIIEDMDAQQELLERTRAHLAAVRDLDEKLDRYLNQLAQAAALEYREAHQRLADAREDLDRAKAELAEQEQELAAVRRRLEAVMAEQGEVRGRIEVLEAHEAFAGERALALAERDRDAARAGLERAAAAVAASQAARQRLQASLERLQGEWDRTRASLGAGAQALAQAAAEAAWPLAAAAAADLTAALDSLRLEAPGQHPVHALAPLRAGGEQRLGALRQALAAARAVEAAEGEYAAARARVAREEAARDDALDAHSAAEEELERARAAAVAALHGWKGAAPELQPPAAAVAAVARAVQEYPHAGPDLRRALDPLATELARQRRAALERQVQELQAERARRGHGRDQVEAELRAWLQRQEAEPPRAPGQERARALLAAGGIPAVPLYAACAFRPHVPAGEAAALEQALAEAGLLDALVVPPEQAAAVAAGLTAAGLGDRWLQPLPPAPGPGPAADPERVPEPTLADYLEPVPGALPAPAVLAALGAVAVSAGAEGAGTPAAVLPDGRWRVGLLTGSSTRREAAEVLYVGAANRRRRREAEVARLRVALAAASAAVAAADADLEALAARLQALAEEVEALRTLPAWAALERAAAEGDRSRRWLERCQQAVARALADQDAAYARLNGAREQFQGALAGAPEARGRTAAGLQELLAATRACLDAAGHLAAQAGGLPHLWQQRQDLAGALAAEEQRLQEALALQGGAREQYTHLAARAEAIRERLAGLQIGELRRQLRDLAARREHLSQEEKGLIKEESRLAEAGRQQAQRVAGARAEEEAAAGQHQRATAHLDARLQAYPTLARHLELCRSGASGALACAEELLRLRRTAPEGLRAAIEESQKEAFRALSTAFAQHQSLLVDYRPQEVGDRVLFEGAGTRLLPCELLARLEEEQRHQLLVVREKENELYEEFILKQVAGHIRDLVARGEEWKDGINGLLAARPLAGGEVLSIEWKPKPPDRVTGVNLARVVELLRQDPDKLHPEQVAELVAHFRTQVEEVRARERRGDQDQSFADALAQVLDYRLWFDFTLHTRQPGQEKQQMTDVRFTARSGAEKSLAMFIPLLAAAHARYRAARPDAPRLVGLDEAFAGVDDENTRKMFSFLVSLDFSWIMTSEKLWGVADTLPGCATYELVRQGTVVTPIFYVWDGTRRWGSLAGALGEAAGGGG